MSVSGAWLGPVKGPAVVGNPASCRRCYGPLVWTAEYLQAHAPPPMPPTRVSNLNARGANAPPAIASMPSPWQDSRVELAVNTAPVVVTPAGVNTTAPPPVPGAPRRVSEPVAPPAKPGPAARTNANRDRVQCPRCHTPMIVNRRGLPQKEHCKICWRDGLSLIHI